MEERLRAMNLRVISMKEWLPEVGEYCQPILFDMRTKRSVQALLTQISWHKLFKSSRDLPAIISAQ